MAHVVHNSVPDTLNRYIMKLALDNPLSHDIEVKLNHRIRNLFNTDLERHKRTPDLTITTKNAKGIDEPFLVVESAFAQSLQSLGEATVDYLQNSQGRIKIVIKVGVKEIVSYKTPFQYVDDEDKEFEYNTLFEKCNTTADMFTVNKSSPTNGVTYKGYPVINPFDAWIEVWKIGKDGQAQRYGRRMVCCTHLKAESF